MVKFAVDTYGGVDVIVSKYVTLIYFLLLIILTFSAGYQHIEPVDDLNLKEWKKVRHFPLPFSSHHNNNLSRCLQSTLMDHFCVPNTQ
jgi:hypothetical protein